MTFWEYLFACGVGAVVPTMLWLLASMEARYWKGLNEEKADKLYRLKDRIRAALKEPER